MVRPLAGPSDGVEYDTIYSAQAARDLLVKLYDRYGRYRVAWVIMAGTIRQLLCRLNWRSYGLPSGPFSSPYMVVVTL